MAEVNSKINELVKQNPKLETVPPELSYVAVINDSMARMFWPNQDPVGKIFVWGGTNTQVIGVVGDVKESGIRAATYPAGIFPPHA